MTTGRLADMIVQLVVAGEIRACDSDQVTFRACCSRLDRVPFLRRDHGEKVLDPDDLRAGNIADRAFVHRDRHRARDWRADHAGMQHAGQAHVGDHVERAEHLPRHVAARHRLADDLEFVRGFFSGAWP